MSILDWFLLRHATTTCPKCWPWCMWTSSHRFLPSFSRLVFLWFWTHPIGYFTLLSLCVRLYVRSCFSSVTSAVCYFQISVPGSSVDSVHTSWRRFQFDRLHRIHHVDLLRHEHAGRDRLPVPQEVQRGSSTCEGNVCCMNTSRKSLNSWDDQCMHVMHLPQGKETHGTIYICTYQWMFGASKVNVESVNLEFIYYGKRIGETEWRNKENYSSWEMCNILK